MSTLALSGHPHRRYLLLITVAVSVVVGGVALLQRLQSPDDVPLPFATSSGLEGAIVDIGTKGGRRVRSFTFALGEMKERMSSGDMIITIMPDVEGISHGAPLSKVLEPGARVFGYKYSSRSATAEKSGVSRAAAGEPLSFSELFPGQFFASAEARANGDFITTFEAQKSVAFFPLSDVTLERGARYVFVSLDAADLTVRGVTWCGDAVVSAPEQCDDGNAVAGDGCSAVCEREPDTVALLPTQLLTYGLWKTSQSGVFEGAPFIDEGVDNLNLGSDYITTDTVLPPAAIDHCVGSVCYPKGSPPSTSLFSLSRVPSNLTLVRGVKLRIVGDRGIDAWSDTVTVRLVSGMSAVPVTQTLQLAPFPMTTATDKRMEMALTPLPGISPAAWNNAYLEMSTNWRYCAMSGGQCIGSDPSTRIVLHALDVILDVECDGACESVTPACPNGILELYGGESCDDGDSIDDNACSNTCTVTGNWWLDALQTVGPVRQLSTNQAAGPVYDFTSDTGLALWYDDYQQSQQIYNGLLASFFVRADGWSTPQKLNPAGTFVYPAPRPEARNNVLQDPRLFDLPGDALSLFFLASNQVRRADIVSPSDTWTFVAYPEGTILETGRTDGSVSIMLFNMPLQPPDTSDFIPLGLYAATYDGMQWSQPRFVKGFENTVVGAARIEAVRQQAHGNIAEMQRILATTQGPTPESAAITGFDAGVYTVTWYGSTMTVPVTAQ